jgi:hypothetical protein
MAAAFATYDPAKMDWNMPQPHVFRAPRRVSSALLSTLGCTEVLLPMAPTEVAWDNSNSSRQGRRRASIPNRFSR